MQLELSRDAVTISNIRAAYAMSQTAYLTQQSDTSNAMDYTAGTGGAATITVGGVVSKGTVDGWSNTTEDLVIKAQVEADCGDLANTPGTYKLKFTYDGDGKITKVEVVS